MCMVKPNEARKDLLDRLTPKRSVTFKNKGRFGSHPASPGRSFNTIDSQQGNRSVFCGWIVRLSLKL